jgi:hypothetical protein
MVLQNTPGSPIRLSPVRVCKGRDRHPPACGGMGKFTVAQVDPHMADFLGRLKKDEIAGMQLALLHESPDKDLELGGPWQPDAEKLVEHVLDEPGTIGAAAAAAAHMVGCAAPVVDHGQQLSGYGTIRRSPAPGARKCRTSRGHVGCVLLRPCAMPRSTC